MSFSFSLRILRLKLNQIYIMIHDQIVKSVMWIPLDHLHIANHDHNITSSSYYYYYYCVVIGHVCKTTLKWNDYLVGN